MNDIINKVASLGGTISTTDISHLSEYKQVLRAKERGDLIRLRHGVYAAPEALLNTMIDVERIIRYADVGLQPDEYRQHALPCRAAHHDGPFRRHGV